MKRNLSIVLSLASIFVVIGADGQPAAKTPNLGRVMWSAFSCAAYAEMAGDESEQKRLFNIGYTAGQKFISGIRDTSISEADAREAPIGVLMYLSGPSIDFMLGRVFENATQDAFDRIVKMDSGGMPILNPLEWVSDEEVKKIKAETKFRNSNCELIQ